MQEERRCRQLELEVEGMRAKMKEAQARARGLESALTKARAERDSLEVRSSCHVSPRALWKRTEQMLRLESYCVVAMASACSDITAKLRLPVPGLCSCIVYPFLKSFTVGGKSATCLRPVVGWCISRTAIVSTTYVFSRVSAPTDRVASSITVRRQSVLPN